MFCFVLLLINIDVGVDCFVATNDATIYFIVDATVFIYGAHISILISTLVCCWCLLSFHIGFGNTMYIYYLVC